MTTAEIITDYASRAQQKIVDLTNIIENKIRYGNTSDSEVWDVKELLNFQKIILDPLNPWSDESKEYWVNFMIERYDLGDYTYQAFDPYYITVIANAANATAGDIYNLQLLLQSQIDALQNQINNNDLDNINLHDLIDALTALLNAHTGNTDIHVTLSDKTFWNSMTTPAQLATALAAKAALVHTHAISDITGLQDALDALASSIANFSGTQWIEITANVTSGVGNFGYVANSASKLEIGLVTNYLRKTIRVTGKGAGGWKLTFSSPVTVLLGDETASASVESTHFNDSIELLNVTNNTWKMISCTGNLQFT